MRGDNPLQGVIIPQGSEREVIILSRGVITLQGSEREVVTLSRG